ETLWPSLRRSRQSPRPWRVDVAAGGRADVAGRVAAPAEVVRRGDVGEEAEAERVSEVETGLDEPWRIDDERRRAVRLARLHQARDALEGQHATPRISYAGRTAAFTF